MSKFVNHYETLNVPSEASLETIRASYHNLCKIFHPDLNPQMEDGLFMIEELTKSYEVLKDVNARQDYDMVYLLEMRRKSTRNVVAPVQMQVVEEKLPALPVVDEKIQDTKNHNPHEFLEIRQRQMMEKKESSGSSFKVAALAALAMIGVLFVGYTVPTTSLSRIKFVDFDRLMSSSKYVRPTMAPNGQAFPEASGYVSGYEQGKNDGASSLLVSNSKNDNDVYLKLISIEENKVSTVRHVFVKGRSDFKIENLSTGKYEVQYMDLAAGLAGKSEVFAVVDSKTDLGVKSTNLSVTLQTAVNGVLKVQNISIEDFHSLASL